MAVKITVKSKRDAESAAALIKKLADPTPYLEMVGEAFLARARQRIHTLKADPQGQRWAPWAASTRAARAAQGTTILGLLFQTGSLYHGLDYQVIAKQKVAIQDRSPYGRFLQNGTPNMPARPFLGTGPWEEKRAGQLWNKWLRQK